MQLSPPAGNEAEPVMERMERNVASEIAAQYFLQYLGRVEGRSRVCQFVEVDMAQLFAGC